MKTSELTGAALDWAVAQIEKPRLSQSFARKNAVVLAHGGLYAPAIDWEQGGPIIEREGISVNCWSFHSMPWKASIEGGTDAGVDLYVEYGDTPLIAAMRCYVASKLGDEIDLPTELK
jgi:hypothetical protein